MVWSQIIASLKVTSRSFGLIFLLVLAAAHNKRDCSLIMLKGNNERSQLGQAVLDASRVWWYCIACVCVNVGR